MNDTESRIAAALKEELDAIEPSPSSWEVIRNAPAGSSDAQTGETRTRSRNLAIAAAVILVLLGGAVFAAVRSSDDVTVAASKDETDPAQPSEGGGGVVVDETGDAREAHLDLADVHLSLGGDVLRMTWNLAGAIPAETEPVEYRVVFTDSLGQITPVVARVRVEGGNHSAAIARCPASGEGSADCTGQAFTALSSAPQIEGATLSLAIPRPDVPIPLSRLVWTAEVLSRG